jgi:hypothetical protein
MAAATPTVPSGTVNLGNLGGNMPSAAGFSPSAQTGLQQGAETAVTKGATPSPGFFGNIKAAINPNDDVGIMQGLNRAFNPNQIEAAARAAGNPDPSMFAKYAPIAGAALGIGALAGGFDAEQPEIPAGYEDMAAGRSPGQKLLTEQPEQYGLQFGGARTTYAPNPYAFMFAPPPPAPITRRDGGIAELRGYRAGGDPSQFPRKNGHINGPGTGTSDDVPAMLSDGEFVFTAKAVRSLGDGSRRKGAKRMLALMKKLEGRSNG